MAGRKTSEHAKRFALESPRLYAVSVIALGGCGLGVLSVIKESGFTLPFVEAFAYIMLAGGLWFLVTGHTFAEPADALPKWWRPGFVVTIAAGGLLGFFLRQ